MSYPTYAINEGSTVETDFGVQFNRASNGAARGRSFYTSGKKKFKVVHWLSAAQLTSYRSYLSGILSSTDTFTWVDGSTYTIIFGEGSLEEKPLGGGFTETEVELLEA